MELNRRQALQALAVLPMVGMVGQEKKGVPAKPSISDVKYPIISVSADMGLEDTEVVVHHIRDRKEYPITIHFCNEILNLYISKVTEDTTDMMTIEHWKTVTTCIKGLESYDNLLSLQKKLVKSPYRTASIFTISPYYSTNDIPKIVLTHNTSHYLFQLQSITVEGVPNDKTIRL